MVTSLTLATMSSKEKSRSIMQGTEQPVAVEQSLPPADNGDNASE
jgi:hypothetical protein